MPAVDLTALNTRIQSLQLYRRDATTYMQRLDDLLNLYASEVIKLGENVPFKTILPQMNIPDLVLQRIIETFPSFAQEFPKNAVTVLDTFWKREELEYKILAVNLLMNLPEDRSSEINKRLPQWTIETDEGIIHQVILDQISKQDISNSPAIQTFIEEIIQSNDHELEKLAFHTLVNVIEQKKFSDIPWVFDLITPIIQNASLNIYKDLTQVISALINKSEIETAAFLVEIYSNSHNEKAKKFIRKIIPLFNTENKEYLTNILR